MKLSVAMCTYNGAQFVEEQLKSILDQEQPVNEIVVCDDGSKDDTLTIVQKIAKEYPHVEWIIQQNTPNLGVTKNFEKAISLCTGDIIFLSDQDDVWHKDKTRVIFNYFEANPQKNVVFTDGDIVGIDGKKISERSILDAALLLPYFHLWENNLIFEILNIGNIATGATMAFRCTIIPELLPFVDEKIFLHDYQIAISGCKNGSLGLIRNRLINYRQHANNAIGVSPNNWIYTSTPPPNLLELIVEPHKINSLFRNWKDERCLFYEFRYCNYSQVLGKIKLLLAFNKYKHFYRKCWLAFFIADILYGVVTYENRKKILNLFRRR